MPPKAIVRQAQARPQWEPRLPRVLLYLERSQTQSAFAENAYSDATVAEVTDYLRRCSTTMKLKYLSLLFEFRQGLLRRVSALYPSLRTAENNRVNARIRGRRALYIMPSGVVSSGPQPNV